MQTKLPREKLTKKHIRKDIKNIFIGGILLGVIFAFFILPMLMLIIKMTECVGADVSRWMSVLLLILAAAILALSIVYTVRLFLLLYKEQYTITIAPLVDKKEGGGAQYNRKYIHAQPYRLYFPPHRRYAFGIRNYEWSELYNLTEEGAYRYSDIGDEFYLVEDKRGKILVAYNTKLFELQDK